MLRHKCYNYTIPKDNLLKSSKFEFRHVFKFSCVLKKRWQSFAIILLIWGCSTDTPSLYFFRLRKVWSMLHHGSVGRVQNKIKNALIYFQVILWQFLLFFIIKFVFLSWCTLLTQLIFNEEEMSIRLYDKVYCLFFIIYGSLLKTTLFVCRRKGNFFHEGGGISPNAPSQLRHCKTHD